MPGQIDKESIVSRLDAIALRFGGDKQRAKEFTRAVRAQFEAAPSYAQIMVALKHIPGRNPDPNRVVKLIRQNLDARDAKRGGRPSMSVNKRRQKGPTSGRQPKKRRSSGRPSRPKG